MLDNDPLDRCQAYACTSELVLAVHSLERCKKPAGPGHIESCAIVTYPDNFLSILYFTADDQFRILSLAAVFKCVVEKVLKYDVKQPFIRLYDDSLFYPANDSCSRIGMLQLFTDP